MVVQLDSRAERLIEEQLHTGRFHSPEDVVARALEALAVRPTHPNPINRSQAVDEMIAFRDSHRLSLGRDFTLTDLIREGRNLD